MAVPSCDVTLPGYDDIAVDISQEFDIVEKYKSLMQATINDESIYERAKATFMVHFKDLQLTETEKAKIISEHTISFSAQMSATSMQTALAWAKEEVGKTYEYTEIVAKTELLQAQTLKVSEDICLAQAEIALKEAELALKQAELDIAHAKSIRENGGMLRDGEGEIIRDAAGIITGLEDEGLKYEQTLQVEAAKYASLADAYRKSGQVLIEEDTDGVTKGVSATDAGHTYYQSMIARRQIVSFEDSKLNHLANSSAQTVGQMISADFEVDVPGTPAYEILEYYKGALEDLSTSTDYETGMPDN